MLLNNSKLVVTWTKNRKPFLQCKSPGCIQMITPRHAMRDLVELCKFLRTGRFGKSLHINGARQNLRCIILNLTFSDWKSSFSNPRFHNLQMIIRQNSTFPRHLVSRSSQTFAVVSMIIQACYMFYWKPSRMWFIFQITWAVHASWDPHRNYLSPILEFFFWI